ncbi:MAG TPA: hypothetical protein VHV55_24995 [Pirellulales bacterium]|nr:hypothetical protein [Pirellulales bacterium]
MNHVDELLALVEPNGNQPRSHCSPDDDTSLHQEAIRRQHNRGLGPHGAQELVIVDVWPEGCVIPRGA